MAAPALRRLDGPLIVGAGLAGLFTALKLAPLPCTVLSPMPLGEGASSAWAQGGVAAALAEGDSPEAHAADTVAAGAGGVDAAVALAVAREAPARIDDLLTFGAPFDRDAVGRLLQSREAAHSAARVVRVKGDGAGAAIMAALIDRVRRTPSITVLEGLAADSLILRDGRVIGVVAHRPGDATPVQLVAGAVVLATGGVGGLYAVTTNPQRVRGEGLGMAARAGGVIGDPEYVQFHPTGLAVDRDPTPLASEAIRGDGAVLIDAQGHRFMPDEHPDAELAPRDVVARAIHRRVSRGEAVLLDPRQALGAAFPDHFPTIARACAEAGIDPVRDPIPVRPVQHYHMGGVRTDAQGRSSLPRLWVCGETACTGLHGANRLASNSLLEALVFGARIASDIGRVAAPEGPIPAAPPIGVEPDAATVATLRQVMTAHVGVERDAEGLRTALRAIAAIDAAAPEAAQAIRNMTATATLIAAGALLREECRGGHARRDFPLTNPTAKATTLTLDDAMAVRTAAVEAPA